MFGVEVMAVIKTTLLRRGNGESQDDPIRIITQYWDMKGDLLFEFDPYLESLKGEG